MNLDELCSKSYLLSIINDEEKLDEAVTNSRGFVLYVMEREGLFPELKLLMNKENIFSFNFILKNYELTKAENKKLRKYFSDNADNQIVNERLTQEEIEEFLTSNQELYHNTILNIDTIKKYSNEIELSKREDSYKIKAILTNSFKELTVEQILSVGDIFLSMNTEQLEPYLKKDKRIKNKYRELKEKNTPIGSMLALRDFRRYPFELEDKKFLHTLLENTVKEIEIENNYDSLKYSEIIDLAGVSELITPIEFFQQYNSEDITSLTIEEIKQNLEIIRKGFLNKIIEKKYYDPLTQLKKGIKNYESMELILTQDFFDTIVKTTKQDVLDFIGSSSRDNSKIDIYIEHLKMNYILANQDNEKIISKFNLERILEEIIFVVDNVIEDERFKKLLTEVLPKKLATEDFFDMLNYRNKGYITLETLKILEGVVENSPSVNLLAFLLQIGTKVITENKNKDKEKIKILKNLINKLIKNLEHSDVANITTYYNYNISSLNQLKKGLNIFKTNANVSNNNINKNNFLSYDKKEINTLSEEHIKLLLLVKKDFYKELLESNYQLSSDSYILLLNEIEREHIKIFLTEYSLKNKEEINKDVEIKKAIIRHPLGKEIINIEDKNLQEENFKEWLINIDEQMNLKKQINDIKVKDYDEYQDYDSLSEEEKISIKQRRDLGDKIEEYVTKNRELEDSFSKEFMKEKLTILLNKGMYSTILTAVNKNSSVIDETLVAASIKKMDFNTILKNIEKEDFREVLFNFATYASTKEKVVQFKLFNDKENTILAELLLPYVHNHKAFLSIFPEKSYTFLKDFLIRKMPKQLLNVYNLREDYIKDVLSSQEIIQLFKNIEKESSIFTEMERNNSYKDFFNKNFKSNKKEYLKTLELAKEDYPKLYTLLINNNILTNHIYEEKRKSNQNHHDIKMTADEEACLFLDKEVDIDIIIEGMKEIAKDINVNLNLKLDQYNNFNSEEALLAIERIIYLSYYEKEGNVDGRHVRYYESRLSQESSDKLMKTLWEINPSLILQFNCIGANLNFSGVLNEKLKECLEYKSYSIVELLYPKIGFQNNNSFNIRSGYGENTWLQKIVHNYVNGLIDYYNDKNKVNELFYMSFLSQQHEFLYEKLSGYYQYPGNTEIMKYIRSNEELSNKINKVSQKLFLENTLVGKNTVIKKSNKL